MGALFLILTIVFASASAAPPPIVGGQAIDIREVPYQVSFLAHGSHICGAIIISSNWVVTAAHCADSLAPNAVTFRGGSSYHASGGQVVRASNIVIHPEYNPSTVNNDIAVVSLLDSFTLSETINVVQLPQPGQDWSDGERSRVTGWGALFEGSGSPSPDLQGVEIPIVELTQCRDFYWFFTITEQMLCAGFLEGGRGACLMDSGGPLTVNGVLAGIVSFGAGCARPALPTVYAHVGALRTFISEQTGI